jgi:hypothetical protein
LAATGGIFPVQTLLLHSGTEVEVLHQRMLRLGVRTVLHRSRISQTPSISLLLRSSHLDSDIDHVFQAMKISVEAEPSHQFPFEVEPIGSFPIRPAGTTRSDS